MKSTVVRHSLWAVALLLVAGWGSPVSAQLDGLDALAAVGADKPPFTVEAQFSVAEGDKPARLFVTAKLDKGWHTYSITQPPGGPVRTRITLDDSKDYKLTGEFKSSPAPDKKKDPAFENVDIVESHHDTVTWYAPLDVTAGIDPKLLKIAGTVIIQACKENTCLPPKPIEFTAKLGKGVDIPKEQASVTYKDVNLSELPYILALSLLGGLILNLMPCVLPVVGLKILSFVEQAGKSRSHVLMLNLVFSAGIMAVFLGLATMSVFLNLAWGEHFQSMPFIITLSALVFTMALSFMGVWEIPIPGFVSTGKATELAAREGLFGAFAKGAFSTILATPCSGPGLGVVFGFTLNQPPWLTYLIFSFIGLGMASPYLLIGAYPALIRFLPKPGAWMDTFKQIMGFVLLGTMVLLFKFFIKPDYFVPTFTLLIGLWAGCWWIGRTPLYERFSKIVKAWAVGAGVATAVGVFAFTVLIPKAPLLPWKAFSSPVLAQHKSDGKTVMIDFTANWCLTCQLNYTWAIDTQPVLDLVKQNGVVPLLADWTDNSPEIKEMLHSLGSDSIPLVAIFPADRPGEPIILRDLLSQKEVLEALQQAGPSRETRNAKRETLNEIKATSTDVPQTLNDHASATLFGGVGK